MSENKYLRTIVKALDDKKGNDIRVIRISEISSMCDYLVMCNNVEHAMREAGAEMKNREGYANGGWILLDYYDIIIHVFSEKERSFYDLDNIWRDGELLRLGEY